MIPLIVFISCLAVTWLSYWLMTRSERSQRKQLLQRLADGSLASSAAQNSEMRAVRNDRLSDMPRFHHLLGRLRIAVYIRRMIEQANLQLTVMRLTMFSAITGLLTAFASSFFAAPMLAQVIIGVMAAGIPFLYVWWKRRQRLHKFLVDLPDALDLMSRGLLAGHAFSESLQLVAGEMPDPVAGEFGKTYEEQRLGLTTKFALRNLTARIPLLDLRLCVTAILIQRETGGNLSELLGKVGETIRERFKILEDLKTLTTSSRVSAWVLCALPFLIGVAIAFLNPDYLSVLWTDPRGHRLIYIALGMQITGMLIVRKIINIKI